MDLPVNRKYSTDYNGLDIVAKRRCDQKLDMLPEIVDDPYDNPLFMSGHSIQPDLWPDIEYPDVYNYLIHSISPYPKEDLKAYKSLDGYCFFIKVGLGDKASILLATVKYSQKISAAPYILGEPVQLPLLTRPSEGLQKHLFSTMKRLWSSGSLSPVYIPTTKCTVY